MPTIAAARTLIQMTELPSVMALAADEIEGGGLPTFDPSKPQALVIGSDVISFTVGVEADFRQAIADSALFAQLVALNKKGTAGDAMKFFDAYLTTLAGLGWMIQTRETATIKLRTDGFDVHSAITGVITAFLAPISGAAAAVVAVLDGLHKMNTNEPFITLFNKRSHSQTLSRFQFTCVYNDPVHGLCAKIAAFALNAEMGETQVLFFKLRKDSSALSRSLGTLSIDTEALKELKPNLAAKVKDFRTRMIADATLTLPADV